MKQRQLSLRVAIAILFLCGTSSRAADVPPPLAPDSSLTVPFPNLPPTLHGVPIDIREGPISYSV